MREIRQSGSEGGAVMNRPYPYQRQAFGRAQSVPRHLRQGLSGGRRGRSPYDPRALIQAPAAGSANRNIVYRNYLTSQRFPVDTVKDELEGFHGRTSPMVFQTM